MYFFLPQPSTNTWNIHRTGYYQASRLAPMRRRIDGTRGRRMRKVIKTFVPAPVFINRSYHIFTGSTATKRKPSINFNWLIFVIWRIVILRWKWSCLDAKTFQHSNVSILHCHEHTANFMLSKYHWQSFLVPFFLYKDLTFADVPHRLSEVATHVQNPR